ncbi:hypothetical protein CPB83DRAFT_907845, partial [Crepidotus variabilis]
MQGVDLPGLQNPPSAMQPTNPLTITKDHAQLLVKHHLDERGDAKVVKVVELANQGFSYCSSIRTFIIDIQVAKSEESLSAISAAFITVSAPLNTDPEDLDTESRVYPPNPLPVLHAITSRILASTSIPISSSSIIDTSLALVPFPYILSPASPDVSSDGIVSLGEARRRGFLGNNPNDPRKLRVDLMLGRFLGEVHKRCVNDWFGVPSSINDAERSTPTPASINDPEPPNSYSWQETFTMLFESVLSEVETILLAVSASDTSPPTQTIQIPSQRIRLLLSRAIGSFLFDDVEEPSLIWFTGSEEDIYVSLTIPPSPGSSPITAILPNLSHAVWGDPLLESFFLGFSGLPSVTSEPSEAFMEAYTSSGGSDRLIVFPRQKTKRIWYTLFLGLVVLRGRLGWQNERARLDAELSDPVGDQLHHRSQSGDNKVTWSKKIISECVQALEKRQATEK